MAVVWKEIAYKDDVATLSDSTPTAIDGGEASAGVGTAASRYDHKHALGPLTADLDFAGHQAKDMVVMQSSSQPSTPVVGMLWMDSEDQKLYVCTSAS